MKRLIVWAFILVIALMPLCANGSGDKDGSAAETKEFAFWRAGTSEAEGVYWADFFEEFLAGRDGVNVTITDAPWSDFKVKLNVAFAGGTAPDIAHYPIASISQRASLGQFVPLDKYYDQWEEKSDYLDNLYSLGEYKGSLYGLVTFTDPRLLFWRKDFFEEAGLDPDKGPENWDELAEYAEKLTIRDGNITVRAGLDVPVQNSNQFVQIFVMQNGGELIDIENNNPTFDSPEAIEAGKYIADLVVNKKVNIPFDQLSSSDQPFEIGKTAMQYNNPSTIINLLKNHPELEGKIGSASPLTKTTQGTFCGARLLYMTSDCDDQDFAWEVMEASMSAEQALVRYDLFKAPVNRNSVLEEYYADNPELNKATIEAIQVGAGIAKVPYFSQLNRAVSMAMERAFNGEDPDVTFKEEADKLRDEIKDFKLTN